MEPTLNLLGLAMPLAVMLGVACLALGALVVGVRARAGVAAERAGLANWQLALFAAVVAFLILQVLTYGLAFVV